MSPEDVEPLRPGNGGPEPIDPHELSPQEPFVVRFDAEPDDDTPAQRPVRTWWFVVAAAVIVVVGMVIGIIMFNAAAPDAARGAASAKGAAAGFVAAVNAGDLPAAAAISCGAFVDDAKSAAQSAKDPDIFYTLDQVRVRADDKTIATASITEHLSLPNGTKQTQPMKISVRRSSGRWLMCGRES